FLAPDEWVDTQVLSLTPARSGYWWENWGQTLGYVAPFRVVPHSVEDIAAAVVGSGNVDRPDTTPVKAVGGGWSFTDAALPFQNPGRGGPGLDPAPRGLAATGPAEHPGWPRGHARTADGPDAAGRRSRCPLLNDVRPDRPA